MSELTKEYFDQVVGSLMTKDAAESLLTKEDAKVFVTKADTLQTEKRIIQRIDESQEEIARLIASTVANPFTERFDKLEAELVAKSRVLNP